MRKRFVSYWEVLKDAFITFVHGDSFTYASSIAFYTIFSLPAVLIISVVIGATLYEENVVRQEMIHQISKLIGSASALEVEKILRNAALDSNGPVAKAIGIGTLVFSATTVFISLQNSLNSVWRIRAKPERGLVKFVINRLLSMAMVMSIGFILLVSLIVDALLVIFQDKLSKFLPDLTVYVLTVSNTIISMAFITLIFALIFRVLPDAKIKWRDVWIGSIVTTVLFTAGKFLIGLYLGNSSVSSAYGAAGSLVIILIWVYYSSVIVLFGAEITYVYAEKIGGQIRPYKNAVRIEVVELERRAS